MLSLRPYQQASLDALYAYWSEAGGNPLIVLPTGAGKALVIAALVRDLIAKYPNLRIGMVTHVRELVSQNFKELLGYWPGAPAGIYSAGLGRRDTRQQILFMGIQSVHRRTRELGAFDVLIVDEAHLIPRSDSTTYGRFISKMRDVTPDMRVVGLTATPFRLDSGRLDMGEGALFDRVVYDANVADLISQGYLSRIFSRATETAISTAGVQKRGGDFVPGQLADAVDKPDITHAIVAEAVKAGHDRAAWIAFCCSVQHALNMRDQIRRHGITCETVTGETPAGERDRIIKAYRSRQIRCLTSVGVLTTGFNAPHVDMLIMARPTESAGLFVQMAGRALRKAEGKADALILDFAGLTRRHGPIDLISGKKPGKAGDGTVPAKACPQCQTLNRLAARECECCGWEFQIQEREVQLDERPSDLPVLSTEGPPWLSVRDMSFARHHKNGSPDSLRAEFHCGLATHRVWVCLEHDGLARRKAHEWWRRMGGGEPPATVEEGLARASHLVWPAQIQVRQNGRYHEVVGYRFHAAQGYAPRATLLAAAE